VLLVRKDLQLHRIQHYHLLFIEITRDLPRQPSTLANLFASVPEVTDLVVRNLDPPDVEDLMLKTEPALISFCQGSGDGIDRFLGISLEGRLEKRLRRRLPSLPRLLEKEWREKLLGKGLVAENAQTDDMVSLSYCRLSKSALLELLH